VDSAGPAGARTLAWRAPLVAAAGLAGDVLTTQVGLPQAGLVGLAVAALVGWRLRFRPSEQARTWQRGAHGERHTARLLRRLHRDGFVVFHDLAVPGSPANAGGVGDRKWGNASWSASGEDVGGLE